MYFLVLDKGAIHNFQVWRVGLDVNVWARTETHREGEVVVVAPPNHP